jgi:NAD(P)-dependent dehydrogenase (short-subunit alcohol dehydrogenase family)
MTFTPDALASENIIISGGCGALGTAIVKRLTDHGAKVTVNDILPTDEGTAHIAGADVADDRFHYVQANLTQPDEATRLLSEAENAFGPVTTALCHLGMVVSGSILDIEPDVFDQVMDLNVKSAFLLGKAVANAAVAADRPAHLIFTTSWVAVVPWPEIGPYITSKAAMNQLMRTFARELAPKNIRANAVSPGIVGAGMALKQWNTEPDYRARAEKAIPLGYLQPLDSVADTFLFMCSPAASYMTGAVVTVDGGASLYPMD